MLRRYCADVLFFLIYTCLFALICRFFTVLSPLLLGALFSALLSPVLRLMQKKWKIPRRILIFTGSAVFLCVIAALLAVSGVFLYRESSHLFGENGYFRADELHPRVQEVITSLIEKAPMLSNTIQENASSVLPTALQYVKGFLKFLLSVPAVLLFPILVYSFTSMFLLCKEKIRRGISVLLGPKNHLKLRHALRAQSAHSSGVVLSYFLLSLITLVQAFIILHVLEMDYPFTTAVLLTVSDVFPVLGPGTVLFPLIVYKLLCGAFAQAIGLFFGWLLISVTRQIVEPRLLSKITKTPGTVMLFAVYSALVLRNFWLIPYTALLSYLWRLFRDAGLLRTKKPRSS